MTPLDRELITALKSGPLTRAQLFEKSDVAQEADDVSKALYRLKKKGDIVVDGSRQEGGKSSTLFCLPDPEHVDPIIKAMDGMELPNIPDADLHAQRLCVLASNPVIAQPVADWLYQLADLISPKEET